MKKPRIAVLIDWYLPGTKAGGPVRSVFSLLTLLKNEFDFYLVTTNRDLGSSAGYPQVEPDKLVFKDNIHYYYFSHEKLSSKQMLSVLDMIKPDLIYLNSFWSFHFSISIVNLKNKGLIKMPVLLAPRGMLGKGALGIKSFKKLAFLFLSKNLDWYKNIAFHATQQQEAADIKNRYRNSKIYTAPNINALAAVENKSVKKTAHVKLFFLSRVSPVKNLHYALTVLRSVPAEYTVEYDIFGNLESTGYWSECEKIIGNLPPNVSVQYKKELQFNEVQETIRQYNFLFLPTLNENFGHSIVESLLCGCPVIISDQTPWNDVEINNAGSAIDLSHPKKFTDCIVAAAQLNAAAFDQKSKDALAYIQKKINLQLVFNQYKTLFNDCIKN